MDERLPKLVMTDAPRLSQVLINLISNAIKFTDKGNVKIIVAYEYDALSIPEECANREPISIDLDEGVANTYTVSNELERGDTWDDILTASRSRTWLID